MYESEDNTICKDRQAAEVLQGHSTVDPVTFSTDGCQIASGFWDYAVRVWDAKTGKQVRTQQRCHIGRFLNPLARKCRGWPMQKRGKIGYVMNSTVSALPGISECSTNSTNCGIPAWSQALAHLSPRIAL